MVLTDLSIRLAGGRLGFLLIHGLGGTPMELRYVAQGLAQAGHTVHVPQLIGHCGTVEELKAIFGPESTEATTWADIRPGWPADAIGRYQPGVDSGTFDYFTEEINGELDASTQAGTFSEDDNQLVQGVAGDPNGIGYFGYAYYAENTDKLKAVPIDSGTGCVAPSPESVRDGTYTPLSRPLFVYPSKAALARPEVKAFFDFYLANVSTLAPAVGYVDMPAEELQATVDVLEAAVGN